PQFFRSYLLAYTYWLGIALGSLAIVLVYNLTGGAWGAVLRRPFESCTRTLPLLALLFLPLLLGLSELYPWASPEGDAELGPPPWKRLYLSLPGFLVPTAV